jgi:hypothetical protein
MNVVVRPVAESRVPLAGAAALDGERGRGDSECQRGQVADDRARGTGSWRLGLAAVTTDRGDHHHACGADRQHPRHARRIDRRPIQRQPEAARGREQPGG